MVLVDIVVDGVSAAAGLVMGEQGQRLAIYSEDARWNFALMNAQLFSCHSKPLPG